MKTTFVSDFDGTISDDDFFEYVKEAFFDDDVLEPWRQYRRGELSHFEALKQIYGTLRAGEEEIRQVINQVKIDEWVIPTFNLCHEAKIPIYIASAGCDYYINILIGSYIEKYDITLVTNSSSYSPATGLYMERPSKESPYYDEKVGISKREIVRQLQEKGERVIFAGDGPPDIESARIADIVFAKKILLEKCKAEGIKTQNFSSFKDIYSFFEKESVK
ncbi:MAG: MtnX-like HAD-IB family phosphatase [Treponema sp.]|nr:MtnX-like HAD-IB family phosphatase [Treponema sp.]